MAADKSGRGLLATASCVEEIDVIHLGDGGTLEFYGKVRNRTEVTLQTALIQEPTTLTITSWVGYLKSGDLALDLGANITLQARSAVAVRTLGAIGACCSDWKQSA
ncbi:MAG: hypothetical protein WBS19_11500 [Candidatus Korobacteraceae bacterium]